MLAPTVKVLSSHETEPLHDLQKHVGEPLGGILGAILQQQTELVPSQPGHHGGGGQAVLEQHGKLAQQLVPGHVPAGVVDHLELIQIHIEERMAPRLGPRRLQKAGEASLEFPAVGQTGEGVMGGLPGELAGEGAGLGHVVEHQHHPYGPAPSIADGGHGVLDGELAPIL